MYIVCIAKTVIQIKAQYQNLAQIVNISARDSHMARICLLWRGATFSVWFVMYVGRHSFTCTSPLYLIYLLSHSKHAPLKMEKIYKSTLYLNIVYQQLW